MICLMSGKFGSKVKKSCQLEYRTQAHHALKLYAAALDVTAGVALGWVGLVYLIYFLFSFSADMDLDRNLLLSLSVTFMSHFSFFIFPHLFFVVFHIFHRLELRLFLFWWLSWRFSFSKVRTLVTERRIDG